MEPGNIRNTGSNIDQTGNFEDQCQEINSTQDKRKRLKDLEQRVTQLLEFARDQRFVRVYRAEGSRDITSPMDKMAKGDHGLTGKYWTKDYHKAAGYKDQGDQRSKEGAQVYSVIVPQSVIDMQDPEDTKQNQIILNPHPECQRQIVDEEAERANLTEPDLESFIDQFSFVKEYQSLKKEIPNS